MIDQMFEFIGHDTDFRNILIEEDSMVYGV